MMDTFIHDLRHALRLWRRSPGFAATVALVLAVGIGANAAMFSILNALLFSPLPGRGADLVGVYSHDRTSPDDYRRRRRLPDVSEAGPTALISRAR